jgi:hypothetical protein
LSINDSLRTAWQIDAGSALVFSLTATEAKPGPRSPPKDTTKKDSTAAKQPATKPAKKKPEPKPSTEPDTTVMDLSIEGVDSQGRTARVALSTYGPVRRPLRTYVYRRPGRDKERFANTYEFVLQSFAIPLADFSRVTPGFDASHLKSVRWLFDRTTAGTVLLDNIGFSRMRSDFLLSSAGAGR